MSNGKNNNDAYSKAKKSCNLANRELRKNNETLKGLQIHEIEPVKLGGNPTDISNKTFLPRDRHAKVVVWWNKRIREARRSMEE
ncbi:hypothetical protein [Anaerosolibacter sp.]|uniref:hypothetical protein n=1 Tax=Anaerosolibacter sp. TaxID=1872527 RepID=UPI00262CCAE6|nr:hypothetical protein [Anaerosolibacter sp.]